MELKGKTAFVTGSVQRIGKCIALKLAEQGANVILHARRYSDAVACTTNAIRKLGQKSFFTCHDLKNSKKTERWFQELLQQHRVIDILVNNACMYPQDSYETLNQTALNQAMAVQLLSPLTMIRSMKKALVSDNCKGAVVNILDTRCRSVDLRHVSYHLAKQAMYRITKELALLYAPDIRINGVAPGLILPEMGRDSDNLVRMAASCPLQTHGNPEDVAQAVIYLLQSPYVTGQVIFVDGGRHLKGSL